MYIHVHIGTHEHEGGKFDSNVSRSAVCSTSSVCRDTGGGFLLEEEDEILQERDCHIVEEHGE